MPRDWASSPAAWYEGKFWLVGGSSFDTERVSNEVWVGSIDKLSGRWSWKPAQTQPNWPARMGHACVTFDGNLWVIGGWDGQGNSLADAHYFDSQKNKWTRVDMGEWHGGCLFAAAVYDTGDGTGAQLNLYGGMKEPFSDTFYNDTWRVKVEKSGEKYTCGRVAIGGYGADTDKPIAACLAVVDGAVYLLASFQSRDGRSSEAKLYNLDLTTVKGNWSPKATLPGL